MAGKYGRKKKNRGRGFGVNASAALIAAIAVLVCGIIVLTVALVSAGNKRHAPASSSSLPSSPPASELPVESSSSEELSSSEEPSSSSSSSVSLPPESSSSQDSIYNGTDKEGVKVYNYLREKDAGKIAITFDDGPSIYTSAILDELNARDIKATFFVLGNRVQNNAELIKRMHDEGHIIANHSFDHTTFKRLSYDECTSQVNRTNSLIEQVTGESPRFLRFPYGSAKPFDNGTAMLCVGWSMDSNDWKDKSEAQLISDVVSNTQSGDIILMHDIQKKTKNSIGRILDGLIEKGFVFVTVEELLDV